MEAGSNMLRIQAEWSYEAKAESEISVEKGEVAVLVDDGNPEWWEIIKADGSAGFVPANFVKRIQPADIGDGVAKLQVNHSEDMKRGSVHDEETVAPAQPRALSKSTSSLPSRPESGDESAADKDLAMPVIPIRRNTSSKGKAPTPRAATPDATIEATSNASLVAAKRQNSKSVLMQPNGVDELPPFWTVTTDANGKTYYVNTETQKTQWERPKPEQPLPKGWVSLRDDTGNTYYYNEESQVSSWTRPAVESGTKAEPAATDFGSVGSVAESGADSESEDESLRHITARRLSSGNILSGFDGTPPPSKSMLYESSIQKKVLLDKGKKGKKSWDTHFAQLKGTQFMLFKDEKSVRQKKMGSFKAQHTLSLSHALVTVLDDPRKRPMFEIKMREDNHFYIQCESESVVSCWVRAIKINQQALSVEPIPHEYDRPPFMAADENHKHTYRKGTEISKRTSDKRSTKKEKDGGASGRRKKEEREKRGMKKSASSRFSVSLDEIDEPTLPPEEKKKMVKKRLFYFLQSRPAKDEVAGIVGSPYFGQTLTMTCSVEANGSPLIELIPNLVVMALTQIEELGLNVEGIYRLSGVATVIHKIKIKADQGEPLDFLQYDDINTVTGALKLFFRELEDPSIPFAMYDKFLEAMRVDDYNERLYRVQDLVNKMPVENFHTLKFLFAHLKKISNNSAVNKMTPTNLAIVFGPTLMKPKVETVSSILNMGYQKNLIELLIEQNEWLFSGSPRNPDADE